MIQKEKLLVQDPFQDIVGQKQLKNQLVSALLSERNVIIVGPPGIGKTTLAKSVANLLSKEGEDKGKFVRVQGSPDLTAEDLIGDIDPLKALQFGPTSPEAFTPGKLFKANKGVLFFDELNRCTEKLQNAMLQVLEEHKATIGSYDVDLPANFIFIGTMNPQDTSTEKLSDVFLDRFDLLYMGYPESYAIEAQIVKSKGKKLEVSFPEELFSLAVSFVRLLRTSDKLEKVPSVRASLGLYERAQANALVAKRKEVIIDDVQNAVISVISHRIELKPSVKYLQSPLDYIKEQFKKFADQFDGIQPEKGGDR